MIDLTIFSPERTLVHEQVHNVTLPSVQGPFQVLHGHAPIVAALEKGVVSYLDNDGLQAVEKYGALKGGLLALWRILRCNPFSKGGYDPVP